MARIFVYNGTEYPDPDPTKTPDEVRLILADFLPELANADVREHKKNGDTYYELLRKVGTKG